MNLFFFLCGIFFKVIFFIMIIVNIFVLEVLLKGKNCVDFFVGMDILVYMECSIVMFG